LTHNPASDHDPYQLLLRAQQRGYEFRMDSQAAALCHLEQALAIDPSYAPAKALAAFSHAERRVHSWTQDPDAETNEGLRLASEAPGKDDPNVFWMAGYVFVRLQDDVIRARELVRHSLDLNPHSRIALSIAGEIETNMRNMGEALDLVNRGMRLGTGEPCGWFMTLKAAWVYFVEGQFDRTVSAVKGVLDQNPHGPYALCFLVASLAKQGRINHAIGVMRKVQAIEPQLTLGKLRTRLSFMEEQIWQDYSAALRVAGLGD
jgi:tetratricopeptide (TPR) repeat protein